MLDNYINGQPIIYSLLKNAIDGKRIAHAYLISSDNIKLANDLAYCLAKTFICPKNKLNNDDCQKCVICHRIDDGNFQELKVIEPDGIWIKKDQLLDLQEEFRMKPLEGNKKVYIISGADKLNVQAANSILKFLEEPAPDIIAILTTNDIHTILPTIISRCQLLTLTNHNSDELDFSDISNKTIIKIGQLYYSNNEELNEFVHGAKNVAKLDAIMAFIKKYEALKLDALLETKKLWYDYFTEKEDYIWALEVMSLFYRDVLNYMCHMKLKLFDYYDDIIEFVATHNEKNKIIHKLQEILLLKEKIKYNVNLNLLLDKLVLGMEGE